MSRSDDLTGLGLAPGLALRMSNAGTGPLTITAAGSSYATSTKLKVAQRVVGATNADGTVGVGLPAIGGNDGPLLGDEFVINNTGGTNSLKVFLSSGVTISAGGTNTSVISVLTNDTLTCYPVSSTQWIGSTSAA